jgi:hypothetical protein
MFWVSSSFCVPGVQLGRGFNLRARPDPDQGLSAKEDVFNELLLVDSSACTFREKENMFATSQISHTPQARTPVTRASNQR